MDNTSAKSAISTAFDCCFLAAALLMPILTYSLYPEVRYNHNLFALITACGFLPLQLKIFFTREPRLLRRPNIVDLALLVTLLISVVSVLRAQETLRLCGYLSICLISVYIYYLSQSFFAAEKEFRILGSIMIGGGALVVFQGLPSLVLTKYELWNLTNHIYLDSRNQTAIGLLLPFFLSFYFFLTARNLIFKAINLILGSAFFTYFIFCRSRAIWLSLTLALAAALFTYFFSAERERRYKLNRRVLIFLACAVLAAALTVIGSEAYEPGHTTKKISTTATTLLFPEEGSAGGRLNIWRNSLEMIKDHFWFGVGLDNWWEIYPLYQNKVVVTSYDRFGPFNSWLALWGEIGTAGFLAAIIFVLLNCFWKVPYTLRSYLLKLCVLCLICAATFHTARRAPYYMVHLSIALGLVRSNAAARFNQLSGTKRVLFHAAVLLFLVINIAVQALFSEESAYRFALMKANDAPFAGEIQLDPATQFLLPGEIRFSEDLLYAETPHHRERMALFGNHDEGSIYYHLSALYLKVGDAPASKEWILKAIKERPYDPIRHLHLCRILREEGDVERALAACLEGHRVDPLIPELPSEIAELYQQKGDSAKEREYLNETVKVAELRLAQHGRELSKYELNSRWQLILSRAKYRLNQLDHPEGLAQ